MRADVRKSPYGPLHAIAAGAVLLFILFGLPVCCYGLRVLHAIWHRFLYGAKMPSDVKSLLVMFISSALLFGGLSLVIWVSTLFTRRKRIEAGLEIESPEVDRPGGIVLALKCAAPMIVAAMVLSSMSTTLVEAITGAKLADQDLIEFMRSDADAAVKLLAIGFVSIVAPVVEELFFRGIVFRGFARSLPVWLAMLLSGFLFAIVHLNAATLVPLWFVGAAFAWLYWKTGTILAPMLVHSLLNLFNLVLVLAFPDL